MKCGLFCFEEDVRTVMLWLLKLLTRIFEICTRVVTIVCLNTVVCHKRTAVANSNIYSFLWSRISMQMWCRARMHTLCSLVLCCSYAIHGSLPVDLFADAALSQPFDVIDADPLPERRPDAVTSFSKHSHVARLGPGPIGMLYL